MRRRLAWLLLLPLAFVLVLAARTVLVRSRQVTPGPAPVTVAESTAVARLAGALCIPTVSGEAEPMRRLHAYLRESFPRTFAQLEVETVNELSLVLRWPGSDPSLLPILMLGHLDVVPVEPGTAGDWTHPPFSGAVADGYVWGRGALDNKQGVLGCLEAVETLLASGFSPRRGVWLAFGHDEEIGGSDGARQIAALFAARGRRFDSVIDEGLPIAGAGMVPGIATPVALIGIGEKGFLSLELTAQGAGGHSSTPPRSTPIGILGRALARLEENPMPARLDGAMGRTMEVLAPEVDLGTRVAFANLWCFDWLVLSQLGENPPADALVRTTTAVTVFRGGVQDNVLPQSARAVVNFRILPGDTVEDVERHVRETVDDPRVTIALHLGEPGDDPPPLADTAGAAYRRLEATLRQCFPEAIVAPSLVSGATDSRHYRALSDTVLRVMPVRASFDDAARVHGTDERLGTANYAEICGFYAQWVINSCE